MKKRIERIVRGNQVGTRERHLAPIAYWYLHSAWREARRAQQTRPPPEEHDQLVEAVRDLPPAQRAAVAESLLLGDGALAVIQARCFLALLYSTLALEAGANEAIFDELDSADQKAIQKGTGSFKKPKGRSAPPWRWCCLLAHIEGGSPTYDSLLEATESLFFARNDLVHYDLEKAAAVEERLLPPGLDAIPLIWPPGYEVIHEEPSTLERLIKPCFAAMAYHTARAVFARANRNLKEPFPLPPAA